MLEDGLSRATEENHIYVLWFWYFVGYEITYAAS